MRREKGDSGIKKRVHLNSGGHGLKCPVGVNVSCVYVGPATDRPLTRFRLRLARMYVQLNESPVGDDL